MSILLNLLLIKMHLVKRTRYNALVHPPVCVCQIVSHGSVKTVEEKDYPHAIFIA